MGKNVTILQKYDVIKCHISATFRSAAYFSKSEAILRGTGISEKSRKFRVYKAATSFSEYNPCHTHTN